MLPTARRGGHLETSAYGVHTFASAESRSVTRVGTRNDASFRSSRLVLCQTPRLAATPSAPRRFARGRLPLEPHRMRKALAGTWVRAAVRVQGELLVVKRSLTSSTSRP